MPFSSDHQAITQTVSAWGHGHNPDGRDTSGESDLPPDLFRRMMRGEMSAHEARLEWQAREPGQRSFNDRLRREARGGFIADAEEVLSQAGNAEGSVSARDVETGQFADLNQAARDAGSQPVSGGIVPTEPATKPVDPIHAAYMRLKARRAEEAA